MDGWCLIIFSRHLYFSEGHAQGKIIRGSRECVAIPSRSSVLLIGADHDLVSHCLVYYCVRKTDRAMRNH